MLKGPYTSAITITNVSVEGTASITKGVDLAIGKSFKFEGRSLDELQAAYAKEGSALFGWLATGAVTKTEEKTVTDEIDGPVNSKVTEYNIEVTFGVVDKNTDFNFASAANTTAQDLDLGDIIPENCFVERAVGICTEDFGTTETIALVFGTVSGGNQLIASSSGASDKDTYVTSAAGASPLAVPTTAKTNAFVRGTPSANWSTVTTGAWKLVLTVRPIL